MVVDVVVAVIDRFDGSVVLGVSWAMLGGV